MALEKVKELSTWLPENGMSLEDGDTILLSRTIRFDGLVKDHLKLDENGNTSIYSNTDDTISFDSSSTTYVDIVTKNFQLLNGCHPQAGSNKDTMFFTGLLEQENVLSGAIDPVRYSTTIQVGAGGAAYTLADGTHTGQIKKIKLKAFEIGPPDTGVVTPANFGSGTDITFGAVGDFIVLRWRIGGWRVLELGNDANGTGGPTIA
jgi:hypothetical protein